MNVVVLGGVTQEFCVITLVLSMLWSAFVYFALTTPREIRKISNLREKWNF